LKPKIRTILNEFYYNSGYIVDTAMTFASSGGGVVVGLTTNLTGLKPTCH